MGHGDNLVIGLGNYICVGLGVSDSFYLGNYKGTGCGVWTYEGQR